MDLPIRYFWFCSAQIDRINAQEDLRAAGIASLANSAEDRYQEYVERLLVDLGTVVLEVNKIPQHLLAPRDESGFEELRQLAAQG